MKCVVRSSTQRDLGLALAERLGREVSLRLLPRRRIADALLGGVQADLLCNYLPDAQLLMSSMRVAAPAGLEDLNGRTIATIGGASSTRSSSRSRGCVFGERMHPMPRRLGGKLATGRMGHAIIGRATFDCLIRHDIEGLTINPR